MNPTIILCLALVLSGALSGGSAAAQDGPKPVNGHGFPMLPPITNADFSITHPVSVRVPTKLKVTRTADMLSVTLDPNGFATTNLMVGTNVVTVVQETLFVYPTSGPRPTNRMVNSVGGAQGQLDFNLGTSFFHAERDGFPQPDINYVVEADLAAFETDTPQNRRIFPWSTNNKILWRQTLKRTVE
jgi:hypothetical protein